MRCYLPLQLVRFVNHRFQFFKRVLSRADSVAFRQHAASRACLDHVGAVLDLIANSRANLIWPVGNSFLDPAIEQVVNDRDVIAASVLSGNRNFEARVHQSIKANFLMSPPLVVAIALAGRVDVDMSSEPIGTGKDGQEVFLRDIWPSTDEINDLMREAFDPETYRRLYSEFAEQNPMWNDIESSVGKVYEWDPNSTYIQEPPYFEDFSMEVGRFSDFSGARALAIFGDSVTMDHISPAGAI